VLDNVQNELTFTNTGEQQSVVIVLEYHTGGTDVPSAVSTVSAPAAMVEYFTASGERVATPGHGLYIERTTTVGGQVVTRKISR
jgi:hypothetical protein